MPYFLKVYRNYSLRYLTSLRVNQKISLRLSAALGIFGPTLSTEFESAKIEIT